jgi:hypothetical protein
MIQDKQCELWEIADELGAKSWKMTSNDERASKRTSKGGIMAHVFGDRFGARIGQTNNGNTDAGDQRGIEFAKPQEDRRLQPFDNNRWMFVRDEKEWQTLIKRRMNATRSDSRISKLESVTTASVDCSYIADNRNATTAELLAGHFGSIGFSVQATHSISIKRHFKIEFWTRMDYLDENVLPQPGASGFRVSVHPT